MFWCDSWSLTAPKLSHETLVTILLLGMYWSKEVVTSHAHLPEFGISWVLVCLNGTTPCSPFSFQAESSEPSLHIKSLHASWSHHLTSGINTKVASRFFFLSLSSGVSSLGTSLVDTVKLPTIHETMVRRLMFNTGPNSLSQHNSSV